MDNIINKLTTSLQTGFIDKEFLSDYAYQPELLVNQKIPPKKILTTILRELSLCEEFYISVAFVTTSGIATIINQLKELEVRGVKGYVLVSQYLNFTEPEALKRLMQFSNIELRILTSENAHAKGYIFKNYSHYNLIVGSSNLTANALATNKEWNIKLSALDKSMLVFSVLEEFNRDFSKAKVVTTEFINQYIDIYNKHKILNKNTGKVDSNDLASVIPNLMQEEALLNLMNLREKLKNKALIISATGTGKTYLSAFDAKAFNPKKLLFVVHRRTIAEDAMKTFKKVFGNSRTMGVYSGETKELDCDFIFSTIQTISKQNHLENFKPNFFDYIVIDETHRSAADSYARLLNYFKPSFLLGMTATPERTDGNNIFEQFDYNIGYEIRLNRAMEEDMLSSFHYYGVTDLYIDNNTIENKSDFNLLVSEERVDRIIEQSKFYGCDNGILRGLIFCSRKDEAKELSRLLNGKGLKTKALTGESSEEERAKAIEAIESNDLNNKLDYILTVDIFNEGIDIPKINQIIMLRPTESAIIFIQQLGRGLRKSEGKGYLTVIDFIGNYENNYLIPIALYGDTSYNKDTIRKLITEGSRMIPGSSTINFDKITKERIFQSIDSAKLQLLADLKKDYNLLKFRLGRVPLMMDFLENNARDPYGFVDYAKSYFNFVKRVDKDSVDDLDETEIKLLELFSKEINNAKRVEESLMLKFLISDNELTTAQLKDFVFAKYGYTISRQTIESCLLNLNFEFVRENKNKQLITVKEIYNLDIIHLNDEKFYLSDTFKTYLSNSIFKNFLLDSTLYSISEFDKSFRIEDWKDGFLLYKKYSRKDVFRILNARENPVAQNVGGYLVSQDNSNCPIFINYHKDEHISVTTKYVDEFINPMEFNCMSKSNRKIHSNDVQSILGKKGSIRLPLFLKKNNDEGHEHYYMGEMKPNLDYVEQASMPNDKGGQVSVVKFRFNVFPAVSDSIYNYINDNSSESKNKPNKEDGMVVLDEDIVKTTRQIPLFNLYAAAGTLDQMQEDREYKLIDAPTNISNTDDFFAVKVVGESMNKIIPNGSICLFRRYSGGSRNGKIMLIEYYDKQDVDFRSAFTVKIYESEKRFTDGSFVHTSIVLKAKSFDESYEDIHLSEDEMSTFVTHAEFVQIIS